MFVQIDNKGCLYFHAPLDILFFYKQRQILTHTHNKRIHDIWSPDNWSLLFISLSGGLRPPDPPLSLLLQTSVSKCRVTKCRDTNESHYFLIHMALYTHCFIYKLLVSSSFQINLSLVKSNHVIPENQNKKNSYIALQCK